MKSRTFAIVVDDSITPEEFKNSYADKIKGRGASYNGIFYIYARNSALVEESLRDVGFPPCNIVICYVKSWGVPANKYNSPTREFQSRKELENYILVKTSQDVSCIKNGDINSAATRLETVRNSITYVTKN